MAEDTTYVGLDTHRKKISIAMLVPGAEPVEWQVQNEPASLRRLIRKLAGHRPMRICYEAGPLGYVLKRQFDTAELPCSERRLRLLGETDASGVVVLSGDRHRGELSSLVHPAIGYPLYDLTASSLNLPIPGDEPNALRVVPLVLDANFG